MLCITRITSACLRQVCKILNAHAYVASVMHHEHEIILAYPGLRPECNEYAVLYSYACVASVKHYGYGLMYAEYAIFNAYACVATGIQYTS